MVTLHVLYLLGSTHASPTVSLAPVENLYHSLLQEEGYTATHGLHVRHSSCEFRVRIFLSVSSIAL